MDKVLGFISEWIYRIIISPLLLIMWWNGRKEIRSGDLVKWNGIIYKVRTVYGYQGIPVADLDQTVKTIIPLNFTCIQLKDLRRVGHEQPTKLSER